jgi:hypothetical protein
METNPRKRAYRKQMERIRKLIEKYPGDVGELAVRRIMKSNGLRPTDVRMAELGYGPLAEPVVVEPAPASEEKPKRKPRRKPKAETPAADKPKTPRRRKAKKKVNADG